MTWLLLALSSVFFLSIANLLQKILMKEDESDALSYSIVFQVMGFLIVGVFAIVHGVTFPDLRDMPLNYILLSVLYGLGTYFIFKALKFIESSEATIIGATDALFTIISAVIILHEPFSINNIIGTILIIISIILIMNISKGYKINKGVLYALGMSVCYGLAVTNDAYMLKRVPDVLTYTSISFLLPGIFLMIISPKSIKKIKVFLEPKLLGKIFLMTLFYCIAAVSFFMALTNGANASQMAPINQSSVILTVVLAVIFLKEKSHISKKIISAVLVSIGVLLLTQ